MVKRAQCLKVTKSPAKTMIIKNADNKDSAIATLLSLQAKADPSQKKRIEDELRMMRAGIKGEQESAYHIDFLLDKSEYTAVIHDLRLEIGGRVAQIDHLLIHRTHRFYVLETKSFSHGLKINEHGEFLRWNDWKKSFEGMPSPIEQNKRHVAVLGEILERLGYKNPAIESFILVSPNARIDRPGGNSFPEVVKADQFLTAFEKNLSAGLSSVGSLIGAVSRMAFGDSPEVIGKKLVRLHRSIAVDYEGKFGMQNTPQANAKPAVSAPASTPQPLKNVAKASHACKSCGGANLSVEYGKFGYYFKCGDCDGNTKISLDCGVAGHKERVRKDKLNFYRECAQCGSSAVFYTNKSAEN